MCRPRLPVPIELLQRTINDRPTSVHRDYFAKRRATPQIYVDNLANEREREGERVESVTNHDFFLRLNDMGGRFALIKMSTGKKESRPRRRTLLRQFLKRRRNDSH